MIATVPLAPWVTDVIVSSSSSGSVSPARTFTAVAEASSATVRLSSSAVGASSSLSIVIVKVCASPVGSPYVVPSIKTDPPSSTGVTVTWATPCAFAAGVKVRRPWFAARCATIAGWVVKRLDSPAPRAIVKWMVSKACSSGAPASNEFTQPAKLAGPLSSSTLTSPSDVNDGSSLTRKS